MTNQPKYSETVEPLQVKRGRVESVNLYEVKENELDILENGEPTGLYLDFAIFLLTLSFSGIMTLFSATFKVDLIKYTFLFVSIVGVIGGFFLLILWWKGRKSIKNIIQKIKDRLPPDKNITITTTFEKSISIPKE